MLKIHHLITGIACTLLVTATLSAQETRRVIEQSDQAKSQATEEIGAGDSHLTDALAQWLVNGNKAEIQLGQLASQKATSPEVKEFAQMMVKEHTAYLQKLQKFTDEKDQPIAGTDSKTEERTTAQTQPKTTPEGQKIEERVAGFRGDKGKHATMEQIGKRAGELHLQMTKELLNKYQGQEFDMAYIGQQIAAHTHMLANLKAMEENTEGEFATVVKEGVQATEMHLKKAQEISDSIQKHGRQEKATGAREGAKEAIDRVE